jgi:hypothetical protein
LAAPGLPTFLVHRQKTAIGSCKVLAGRNVENKEWILRFFIGVKICVIKNSTTGSMKKLIIVFLLLGIFKIHAQDYDPIDQRIQSLPKKDYATLEALYKEIIFSAYSEAEKVRAIAMWIIYNIAYDVEYKHSKTPLETLTRRKGVCQSYAEFFKALCDLAGIECHVVVGHGRNHASLIGMPMRSNHAWNAVKIDGKFHLFDLTWAAGYVNEKEFTQRFNSHYYMTPPEWFILDHYPNDPKWQLLDKPTSKGELSSKPIFEKGYFLLKIRDLKPETGIIRSDTVKIRFKSDQEIVDAMVFRFRFNDYNMVWGEDMTIRRNGKEYEIGYIEKQLGAYYYSISLNGILAFKYKVATPGYRPDPPTEWDLNNPHSLIEAYHYVFHEFDQKLFDQLNPGVEAILIKDIPMAGELNQSLATWYGDYERFYIMGPGEIVTFEVDDFLLILQRNGSGWVFKEIRRRA